VKHLGGAYDPYEKYGLKRVINAATSLTLLGGSMPHTDVFKAMEDASKAFVSIPVLQHWAGERIAEAFGAEAGLPTAGAVNALILAVASCMMKGTELEDHNPLGPSGWSHLIQRLPMRTEGLKTEFIVQGVNRNVYDHAVECAGARLVEAGSKESTTQSDLSEAFNEENTAGYYYTVTTSKGKLPIKDVAEVAHDHGVPLIVDAAPSLTHKAIPRGILEGRPRDLQRRKADGRPQQQRPPHREERSREACPPPILPLRRNRQSLQDEQGDHRRARQGSRTLHGERRQRILQRLRRED
jgi:L-seryl-tRNA(Ser) seleniumtransferase